MNYEEARKQAEKVVSMHHYATKLKFGSGVRANELILKIGFDEAAKLSTDEFLKRVASETKAATIEEKQIYSEPTRI